MPETQSLSKPKDPLVEALRYIARCYGNYATRAVLLSGLPIEDNCPLPIELLQRAAKNVALKTTRETTKLKDIRANALPALLVLANGELRILCEINTTLGLAKTLDPLATDKPQTLSIQALEALYDNLAIFFRPFAIDGDNSGHVSEEGHWFWSVLSQYWREYVHIALAALLINALALASPMFVMNVYDRVLPNYALPTLWALAGGVILALVFDGIFKAARSTILNVTGKQADLALASKIFARAMAVDMSKRPGSTGQIVNHIKEFETVREFFTSASLVALIDLCFIGLFVLVLFLIVGPLAYVPLAAVPIVIAINLLVQAPLKGSVDNASRESANRHAVLVESIANMDTVRALNAEGHMQGKWERSVAASSTALLRGRRWSTAAQSLTGLAQALVSVVIVIWGVYLVNEGMVNMGGLIAAMMLSGRVLAPLASVAGALTRLRQTMQSYSTLNTLMQTPTERDSEKTYVNRSVGRGRLEFRHVDFRYPESETDSLSQINLSIAPGEKVGVIGRVGAGKTTLGRLMCGLHYPSAGMVLVDGVDTRQFDPTDLRAGVGFLSQDNVLFSGSLRENIAFGRPHASNDDILRAAHLAGLEEVVHSHPKGFDRPVGEGGRLLSGGQKQSVALARLLLRQPKIMFLDEPSSHLDTSAEERLLTRLSAFNASGMTLFISTHRLSLLKLTDRLIALDGGRIVADGPREQVLAELQKRGENRPSPKNSAAPQNSAAFQNSAASPPPEKAAKRSLATTGGK